MIGHRLRLAALLAALIAYPASSATHTNLQARIESLLAQFPTLQKADVGYKFVDLTNDNALAEQSASKFLVPASNTKLYTTALALVRLGPGYRFQTELRTSGVWNPGQTTLSDLQIVGGGDPNLSGQIFPYVVDAKPGDPLEPLRDLAKKLADAGVKTISGDVTGVSTRYPGDAYPGGWTIEDSLYGYGAPVSALSFNDNAAVVILHPSETGEIALLDTKPAATSLLFLNQVVTDDSNQVHVHFSRMPGSNEVVLWGTIGKRADAWQEDVAVPDPALWAARALIQVLREQGITVRGQAVSRYASLNELSNAAQTQASGTVLASRQSVPLSQEIAFTNKVSDNLHAEMLLREVGFVTRGAGTLKAGVDERNTFLLQFGITQSGTGVALLDGSGLARQDLTTPESTVWLLQAMWNRPEREVWVASLPIGGVDGTLEHRFKNIPGAERVHAKTGSLSHVNTLSGYIEKKDGGWLVFSVMVNGTAGHDADARKFIDHLCALFLSL